MIPVNDGVPVMSGDYMRIKRVGGETVQLCPNTVKNLKEFFQRKEILNVDYLNMQHILDIFNNANDTSIGYIEEKYGLKFIRESGKIVKVEAGI